MQFDKYSKFSINNINEEHVEFILIISKLYDATIKKLPSDKIIMILDDLEDYTYTHFRLEEKLYCYICRPELAENIPAFSSDTYTKKIKRFRLEIGTADGVTISVDSSIAYVTHDFLENALSLKSDLIELQKIKDYLGLEDLQSALGYSYLGEFYLG